MVSAIVMGLFIVLGVIGIFRQGLKIRPRNEKVGKRKNDHCNLYPKAARESKCPCCHREMQRMISD